ncbi:hypothetical protein QTI66_02745 [Variovorax sp. J22R133]|uniref:hypothetical protein n=1 Tax=Variovorax brevis TaxID=3053503 RepID=UPI0025752824|nr:hypothetical protein [Variovorax sp. J22R133]MDM0111046.1 hypothetical protein [Variovorax sp. J22R133]
MADAPEERNPHARLEAWTWTLIYGGLFALVLGIATARNDTMLGWIIGVPGVVIATVGAVLIYVRSRLDPPKDKK